MQCSAAAVTVVSVVFSSMWSTSDAQSPIPLFPTNERELRGTLNDISYSVNRITSPNTKISSAFLERLLRSLEKPSLNRSGPTQEPFGLGRLVFNIINWSLNLAKDIKNRNITIDTVSNETSSVVIVDSKTTPEP